MPPLFIEIVVFFFGLIWGSFANVCVYRLPRDLSVVFPRSKCTRCGTGIAWYDNIPILSYLILRGRCRGCATSFSLRYPFLELLTGVAAVLIYRRLGLTFMSGYVFILSVSLIVVSAIDLEHRIIPDVISIPGTWIGLALAGLTTWLGVSWLVTFKEALMGAAVGAGLLWGVGKIYEMVTGREGIGFGDVKLLALFGAHAGISGVLNSLFLGSLLGSVVGITGILLKRQGRREPIPFGPFLCLGLLIHAVSGGMQWAIALLEKL